MNIIRDDELNGLLMIPLLNQYGIANCMVDGCKEKANTILADEAYNPIGICETHYRKAEKEGQFKYKIIFNQ